MNKMKLSIDRLTIGLYIELPGSWGKHPFLFNSFLIKDSDQIKILQSLTFEYVSYIPEKSTCVPLPADTTPVDENLENKVVDTAYNEYLDALWKEKESSVEEQKAYIRSLRKCENQFNKSLAIVRSINLKLEGQGIQALKDAKELITSITEKLNGTDSPVLHLMEEGKEGDKYHSHIFHVSIIACY